MIIIFSHHYIHIFATFDEFGIYQTGAPNFSKFIGKFVVLGWAQL